MPNFPSLSISIRRCYLMSSTIIGFARVVIDNEILLKEIPIFRSEDNLLVQLSINQVAACPEVMDMNMLNRMVWHFRDFMEAAIVEEFNKQRNGTIN